MKLARLTPVVGAFRILRKRLGELGRPAVGVWADSGEKAARQLGEGISTAAHASETCDRESLAAQNQLLAGLADGRVDPEDLANLRKSIRLTNRSAELDHDIGEAVRP